jgi:hypothetical protein
MDVEGVKCGGDYSAVTEHVPDFNIDNMAPEF